MQNNELQKATGGGLVRRTFNLQPATALPSHLPTILPVDLSPPPHYPLRTGPRSRPETLPRPKRAPALVLKRTPLHDRHEALGAKMTDFGGFDMPVQYDSIIAEHHAVRNQAGLFDISHMGEIFARGPGAFDFVQRLVTNDAATLYDGRVMYTAMCNAEGGVLDDLVVYRHSEEEYMLVVNAANIEKDFAWMQEHNDAGADLENASSDTALLALQGPRSFDLLSELTDAPLDDLSFYHSLTLPDGAFFGSGRATLSHTGYTGEKGLEVYCDADCAPDVWDALLEEGSGVKPVGLGARDTLRLEAGLCLYGQDLTEETNPIEAGLGWVVKPEASDFVGRDALAEIKARGPERSLVGFVVTERGIPRPGYALLDANEDEIGAVTSGSQSPTLERGLGLGYVPNEPRFTDEGSLLKVQTRRRTLQAEVRDTPFHK